MAGISAGIDMVMLPESPEEHKEFQSILAYLVKRNFIPMSRIDDAVRRILRIKFIMGLFENPFADYSMIKYLGHPVSELLLLPLFSFFLFSGV